MELPKHPAAAAGLSGPTGEDRQRPPPSKCPSASRRRPACVSRVAVMSIEYTIDIQLTELGFPDVVSGRDTRSVPASPKQKVQPARAVSDASDASAVRCKPARLSGSVHDEQGKGRTAGPPAGGTRTGHGGDGGGSGVEEEEDSDDSEVSDVCEEEEVDYYEDEDGLCVGMCSRLPEMFLEVTCVSIHDLCGCLESHPLSFFFPPLSPGRLESSLGIPLWRLRSPASLPVQAPGPHEPAHWSAAVLLRRMRQAILPDLQLPSPPAHARQGG